VEAFKIVLYKDLFPKLKIQLNTLFIIPQAPTNKSLY
jgi:hypothetical protein